MISNLIALPYELARKPLAAASARLPEAVGSRISWALGSADKVAGSLLRSPEIAERGADRVERSTDQLAAVKLERRAERRREEAERTEVAGRQEAAMKREAAQERAASGLDEAEAAEARGKQEAKERAADTAQSKKTAAAKRAASKKTAAERRKEQVASVADAKQQSAQRTAKAQLDDARQDAQVADEARADADRLEELAEVKKQERKQD